jgi:hypothetical protein
MKKKSALIFGLTLICLLLFGGKTILGRDLIKDLPRLTIVCENKAGLLHGFDDGFSVLKKCPKGTREIALGEKSINNNNISGKVLFVGPMTLLNDGSVWEFGGDYQNKVYSFHKTERTIPISASDVAQWYGASQENFFVTRDGDVYVWTQISELANGWVKSTFEK